MVGSYKGSDAGYGAVAVDCVKVLVVAVRIAFKALILWRGGGRKNCGLVFLGLKAMVGAAITGASTRFLNI
jgi:hypothetical protein